MARHGRVWFAGIASAVLVAGAMAAALPAAAQDRDRDRRDDERHHRERVVHERREPAPAYGYGVPTYVPDPPPVVYAPPAPTGGLSLFFNFR
jgi:hypothetical protein